MSDFGHGGSVQYNVFGDNNGPRNEPAIVSFQPNGTRNQSHIVPSRTSVDGTGQPEAGQTTHHDLANNQNSFANMVQATSASPTFQAGPTSGPNGGTGESRGMGR